MDGPLQGLTARAVIIIDEQDRILYTELVEEISNEPDYERAAKLLS
jgi:thiol peroxidase